MVAREKKKSLTLSTAVLVLVLAGLVQQTLGRVARNTIDPVATVSTKGRTLLVTGPISCTQSEWVDLQVTVTQRETGAVAEGRGRIECGVDTQQWKVRALTQDNEVFEEGPAIAVAVARSGVHGKATDAHQWLVSVTLVRE